MPEISRRRRSTSAPSTSRYREEPETDEDDDDDDADEAPRGRTRARGERPTRSRRAAEPDDDDDDDDDADDDDDDDAPRSRGRSSRAEAPARRRSSRSRDDDDDDDDADDDGDDDDDDDDDTSSRRGRGRVTRASSRGRDKAPARGSRRRSRDDEDDDDDDEPRTKKTAKGGWDSYKKQRAASFSSDEFKIEEGAEEVLIKILDDEPFATYRQHWIEGLRSTNRKSFICLEENCPLDAVDDQPNAMAAFNIVDMSSGDEPQLKVWLVGSGIAQTLEKKSRAKTGPLSKEYYAVSKDKSGANHKGPVRWEIDVVRERDVKKEWKMPPLTDDELDAFDEKAKGPEYIKYPRRSELREIAREASRADD